MPPLALTLSRQREGTLCPLSPKSHHISSKQLCVWSYCFVTFFLGVVHSEKLSSTNQSSCTLPWQPYNFFLFLKTWICIVFHVIQPEWNFLWDNLLSFRDHNTLRSIMKANIRSVTTERFRKSFCPNMVIDTNWLVPCFTVYNEHFCHRNPLRCFAFFLTIFLAHSSDLSFVPHMVVHTPCRSPRLASGYLAYAR